METKGKGKALDFGGDVPHVFTYRHLLTNKMGVLDPFRVVALCDLDAFYAAAERVRLNLDPELPLAVQQWQSLIAVNYPARKFGITRMETIDEAKKKCPHLILVHTATYRAGETEAGYWENPTVETHKVSLDHYRSESMKILNVHRQYMPEGVEVEKASIDEAFFDFTVPIKDAIISRYPELAQVPSDSLDGLDTPLPPPPPIVWDNLGNVVPIEVHSTHKPNDTTMEGAPSTEDATHETTWHDVALSIGAEFMMKSRICVKEQLGYTTSAGIARNKMLAKLVASYKKMDQQSILRDAAVEGWLRPMPFQKIRFLGGKLGSALADEYGAKTVGDVLTVSLEEMQNKFGEDSIWVYNLLRGIDHTEVKDRIATKSMLASKNFRPNLTKQEEVTHWLRVLAVELAVRLSEAREVSPSIWPKTLVMHFRQAFNQTKSKQVPFSFSRIITPEIIVKPAEKLFKELSGNSSYKINNLSLAFHGLNALETGQRGLEGFLAGQAKNQDIAPAREATPPRKRKRSLESEAGRSKEPRDASQPPDRPSTSSSVLPTSFHCPRCKKTISLSKKALASGDLGSAIEQLEFEHNDYHIAQDLAREVIDVSSSPESVPEIKAKPKPKKTKSGNGVVPSKKDGIARYFMAGGSSKR